MKHGLRRGRVLVPLLFNLFFAVVIDVAYTSFKVGRDIMDALMHPRKKNGGKGERGETAGEPSLPTLLWDTLYADDAGVVSKSTEQLIKMMGLVGVVCTAFCLTEPETKTEIMCLRTKGMPEVASIICVEAAG